MGAVAIKRCAVLGLSHRSDASKPISAGAQSICVVVEQGMFRDEATSSRVKFINAAGGGQKCLEQGSLTILVKVSLWLGNRTGQILAKPRIVLFIAALGRSNHNTSLCRQLAKERGA